MYQEKYQHLFKFNWYCLFLIHNLFVKFLLFKQCLDFLFTKYYCFYCFFSLNFIVSASIFTITKSFFILLLPLLFVFIIRLKFSFFVFFFIFSFFAFLFWLLILLLFFLNIILINFNILLIFLELLKYKILWYQ